MGPERRPRWATPLILAATQRIVAMRNKRLDNFSDDELDALESTGIYLAGKIRRGGERFRGKTKIRLTRFTTAGRRHGVEEGLKARVSSRKARISRGTSHGSLREDVRRLVIRTSDASLFSSEPFSRRLITDNGIFALRNIVVDVIYNNNW